MTVIEKSQLNQWLDNHNQWQYEQPEIVLQKDFKDFVEAFGFLSRVGILAEKHGHHPTIENSYNHVRLSMVTHDADDQITDKDLNLAEAIEGLL